MSCEQETLRVILQNQFDRLENLVQMNNQAMLAIPSILGAIWGVGGGLNYFRNAWILSILSIALVLIWRYFAHYLDDDIAQTYTKIIDLERELDVPPRLSLFTNLIKGIKKRQTVGEKEKNDIDTLCDDQKRSFIQNLIEKKRVGSRGHDKWDVIAFCLTFGFFMIILSNQHSYHRFFVFNFIIPVIGFFFLAGFSFLIIGGMFSLSSFLMMPILLTSIFSIGLWGFFFIVFDKEIQQDASNGEIGIAIKEVRYPFLKAT